MPHIALSEAATAAIAVKVKETSEVEVLSAKLFGVISAEHVSVETAERALGQVKTLVRTHTTAGK